LLLDGLWAGIREQATLYTDKSGADLYVLQPGVRDLTAGTSVLPLSTLDTVRADPDVSWAAPVRTTYVVLQLHSTKVAAYVVGSVPGLQGGPWSITNGRETRADDEIVLDRLLADRHGIDVGDTLSVIGRPLRVVGLSDSSAFMFPYVFVTHSATDTALGADTTSMIVAGASKPLDVSRRLHAAGLNVKLRDEVAANDERLATGIYGSPIRLMVAIGFAAGTLIIALTGYSAIIERRREYGIVKAMGATGSRLIRAAVAQTSAIAGLGLAAGIALFVAGRGLIGELRPQFAVVLSTGSVGRAAVAALAMALLAAIVPAGRLAALEPAVAYRSAT
jgi:putative ABC transport system permease protein